MEVRNISSNRQARKGLSCSPVANIRGNTSDNLHALSISRIHDRTTADSVDCHAINQVSMPPLLASTDVAREETKGVFSDCREAKPSDLSTNCEGDSHWEEWYQSLWKLKLSGSHQD